MNAVTKRAAELGWTYNSLWGGWRRKRDIILPAIYRKGRWMCTRISKYRGRTRSLDVLPSNHAMTLTAALDYFEKRRKK